MNSNHTLYLKAFLFVITTLAGGWMTFPLARLSYQTRKLMLLFGGSYLFSTTLLHVLPETFEHFPAHSAIPVGVYLLVGFYLQLFLDFLGQGICHSHQGHATPRVSAPLLSSVLILFSLCLHALLEGIFMATSGTTHVTHHHTTHTLLITSILLHKVPAALALTTTLDHHGRSRKTIIGSLFLFALATPTAWLLTSYLQTATSWAASLVPLSAIATGSILHISATILFESDLEHRLSLPHGLAMLLGCLLPLVLTLFGHSH